MYLFAWMFRLDICPAAGLLDHMVVLYLVFWGTSLLFSIVVVPIYIPTNSEGRYPFLHTLSNICYLDLDMGKGRKSLPWNVIISSGHPYGPESEFLLSENPGQEFNHVVKEIMLQAIGRSKKESWENTSYIYWSNGFFFQNLERYFKKE